jgi:hypothetical protein
MYSAMKPATPARKKPSRQPQASIAASDSIAVSAVATSDAVSRPAPVDICWNEPKKPRRWTGADSIRNVAALLASPPAPKPCASRASRTRAGARTPIVP